MTKPAELREILRTTAEIDWKMSTHPAGREDNRFTPWMPFPAYEFISLTAEALPDSNGERFLEIGCGPGTRMLLAQEIFGLDVTGIERVAEYADRGRQLGLTIIEADATTWGGYPNYDIVWFNRPIRDRAMQRDLEAKVWNEVSSGTVVMCANLENPPPRDWILILEDWEVRRGIWRKP